MSKSRSGLGRWRWTLRAATVGVVAGFCVSLSSVASAQEIDDASRTAARAMGNSGVEAYQAGNYQEAVDRLEKAYGIARVPSLGLWSARALRKLGLLVEAANRYLETSFQRTGQAGGQDGGHLLFQVRRACGDDLGGSRTG
jgi:Tfp pilus assembly protein PilF